MNTDELAHLVNRSKSPVDTAVVREKVEQDLNLPFFNYNGPYPLGVASVVNQCWVDLQQVIDKSYGPASKQFLLSLLSLSNYWNRKANVDEISPAEKALCRYNAALINSVVLSTVDKNRY